MTTYKMLELSTCHIPYAEKAALDKWANYQNEYGWIIWCSTDTDEFFEVAPVLAFIIKYANRHDYDYLLLDGDGAVSDDLPVFVWPAKADTDKQEVKS